MLKEFERYLSNNSNDDDDATTPVTTITTTTKIRQQQHKHNKLFEMTIILALRYSELPVVDEGVVLGLGELSPSDPTLSQRCDSIVPT